MCFSSVHPGRAVSRQQRHWWSVAGDSRLLFFHSFAKTSAPLPTGSKKGSSLVDVLWSSFVLVEANQFLTARMRINWIWECAMSLTSLSFIFWKTQMFLELLALLTHTDVSLMYWWVTIHLSDHCYCFLIVNLYFLHTAQCLDLHAWMVRVWILTVFVRKDSGVLL